MSKSCIITVTQGDWQYIDEWIKWHRDIGVDLFLIGYNGPSSKLKMLKEYDYVRWMDFSYNDTNLQHFKLDAFSDWSSTNPYEQHRMQQIENILLSYLKWMYQDIKYSIIIDTDEFMHIKDNSFSNINDLLDTEFNDNTINKLIQMEFYHDNDLIYYEDKPCNERFKYPRRDPLFRCHGGRKSILNMSHPKMKNNEVILSNPHIITMGQYDLIPNEKLALKHFWSKTLEEWIMKFNEDNDSDYLKRFRGHVFKEFFEPIVENKMTDEKIRAIPELLKKHHVNYDVNEEEDSEFKKRYFEIFPEQKHEINT